MIRESPAKKQSFFWREILLSFYYKMIGESTTKEKSFFFGGWFTISFYSKTNSTFLVYSTGLYWRQGFFKSFINDLLKWLENRPPKKAKLFWWVILLSDKFFLCLVNGAVFETGIFLKIFNDLLNDKRISR